MRKIPKQLLFKGELAATLSNFSYATPWAYAHAEFQDKILGTKLAAVTAMMAYSQDLEERELPEAEEDRLWENKFCELGLTATDLDLDKDGLWSVCCDEQSIDPVRAIRYDSNGSLDW